MTEDRESCHYIPVKSIQLFFYLLIQPRVLMILLHEPMRYLKKPMRYYKGSRH